MKVSDVIKALTEYYKPEDHLAIAWWDFETFGYNSDIKKEDWPEICEFLEGEMNWSNTHEHLLDLINQ